jgi:hydrogenase maturation protease
MIDVIKTPVLRVMPNDGATARAATVVLGIGNILLRDDGFGVRVVEALESHGLPGGVEALDGATAGVDLVDMIEGRDRVILVDALRAEGVPGTIMRLRGDELEIYDGHAMSLHQIGFVEALRMSRLLGVPPREVVVFGVIPAEITYGLDLSPAVAAAVPKAVRLVLAELRKRP